MGQLEEMEKGKKVRYCVAYNCSVKQNAKSRAEGITFHRFPKDEADRKEWVKATRRENFNPAENKLCSKHFTEDCFEQSGWSSVRYIKKGKIPTIFDFTPNPCRNSRKVLKGGSQHFCTSACTTKRIANLEQNRELLKTQPQSNASHLTIPAQHGVYNQSLNLQTSLRSADTSMQELQSESHNSRLIPHEAVYVPCHFLTPLSSADTIKKELQSVSQDTTSIPHEAVYLPSNFQSPLGSSGTIKQELLSEPHDMMSISQDATSVPAKYQTPLTSAVTIKQEVENEPLDNISIPQEAVYVPVQTPLRSADTINKELQSAGYDEGPSNDETAWVINPTHDTSSLSVTNTGNIPSSLNCLPGPSVSRKRKVYIGDYTVDDMDTPRFAKKFFSMSTRIIQKKKRQIRALQQMTKRLRAKICTLHSSINYLVDKDLISPSASKLLLEGLSEVDTDSISTSENDKNEYVNKQKQSKDLIEN